MQHSVIFTLSFIPNEKTNNYHNIIYDFLQQNDMIRLILYLI